MRIVIIGGGVAGTIAAEEIRKHDPVAEITLVSEEFHALYSRVLLPHYLKGKVPRERVFLKKETWYADQKIEWLVGTSVNKLDPTNKFVALSDGRELPYDKALIATGGEVRTVAEDLRGVMYFRTLDDADHIEQLIKEDRTPGVPPSGVVLGSGFIACEFINLFHQYGIQTTVTHRGPHFWMKVFGEEAGALIAAHLKKNSVVYLPDMEKLELIGEKELAGVRVSEKEISCSLLGIGIGLEPDFSWIKEAGIEVNKGIKANAYLETNIPDIYTAGDIAEFDDVVAGRQRTVGNWMNAMSQGRTVAKTILGERTEFRLVSPYATDLLGLPIVFMGDTHEDFADKLEIEGSAAEGWVKQVFWRQNKPVGAVLINRNQERAEMTKKINGN